MPQLGEEHLDPHLLLWDIHRNLDLDAMPDGRTVLAFQLHDAREGSRRWWLVADDDHVEVCDIDPGHEITAHIEGSLSALTRVWLGDLGWGEAVRGGALVISAPDAVRQALPRWLRMSTFARVPRPATTA